MKSYFVFSAGFHVAMLLFLATVGTLLAKPKKSYYSVDLMSSMSSGGAPGASSAVATPEPKAVTVPTPAAPKMKAPKMAPAPVRQAEEEEPAEDTMRLLAKLKKKRMTQAKARTYEDSSPRAAREDYEPERAAPSRGGSSGHGGGGGSLGAGPGISVGNGTPFPFPWYIKAIYQRLDKQWRPPSSYDPGTTCVVSFKIARDGQISGTRMTKSSRDSFFDGIALRAVNSANPMPPLPGGYPEETLDVHMTFLGK